MGKFYFRVSHGDGDHYIKDGEFSNREKAMKFLNGNKRVNPEVDYRLEQHELNLLDGMVEYTLYEGTVEFPSGSTFISRRRVFGFPRNATQSTPWGENGQTLFRLISSVSYKGALEEAERLWGRWNEENPDQICHGLKILPYKGCGEE